MSSISHSGPAPAAPRANESILQRQVALADLVELDGFRDVMRSFADLYRIGVKVFDAAGNKIVDVRVGNSGLCSYLWEHGSTRKACTQVVTGLKNDPFTIDAGQEAPQSVTCFTGLRYVVIPISYAGDHFGRLIFGPYLPAQSASLSENLYQIEPKLERQKAQQHLESVRRAPDDLVSKILRQMQHVVEVILFTSYRALLTSQMHIESVTASYHELQEKNRVLKEQNEKLQEFDKLKSNFLATISHELRTPLTSVIGYSEMLLEGMAGELNTEQREYIRTIMDKGEALLHLISQILDLSRIESGNMRLAVTEFSLRDVLRAATTSVIPQCQKKNIALDVRVAEELPFFRGDREKIGQIVVNLLGNAMKFTPEGGRIVLRADRFVGKRRPSRQSEPDHGAGALFDLPEEAFIRIEVEDTGIGIPRDKVDRIFERFFQIDGSSTREYGGSGLGLSIVRSFVEAHRGEIRVRSEEGRGSCFTVLLPME